MLYTRDGDCHGMREAWKTNMFTIEFGDRDQD